MRSPPISFEALFVGQLVGSILLVVSLFLGGLSLLTVVGGAIVFAAIAGLALAAFTSDPDAEPIADVDAGDPAPPLGRGAK